MILSEMQQKVKDENLDAYLVEYGNHFIGQDILPKEHKLKYLCGFSGSAGMLAVTKNRAYLFVDGRYELQSRQEVDLQKVEVVDAAPSLKNVCTYLAEQNLKRIGYDGMNLTAGELQAVQTDFPNLDFTDTGDWLQINNAAEIEVKERETKYSGLTAVEKINGVKYLLNRYMADYFLFTAADSVSWLLNIYARDLKCSPVVRAYALVKADGSCVLVGDNLQTTKFEVWSFEKFLNWLSNTEAHILYDACTIPDKVKKLLKNGQSVPDCCQFQKAEKNGVELNGMIACHKRDGVALVKLLCWLEQNWQDKTELEVVAKLHQLRKEQNLFFCESFETIAGTAENGAVVHYQPTEKSNKKLQKNNLLLIDSGGQYLDGTTDVTRTVALGEPSKEMIHNFTLVLKGHISLAQAVFPVGTSGIQLDALARLPLWREGKDFKHGTGHGVGCFGNVHEGPNRISAKGSIYGFKPNMITSIEPGYYKENAYGIRIENLVYSKISEKYVGFLEFAPLTLVPIDKKLIDVYLLEQGEQDWLNNYHRKVYESLAACVNDDEKKWLKESCSPL